MLEVTDATFDAEVAEDSNGLVLMDFWAPWCSPCRQLSKVLEGLEASYPNVKFVKINTDDNPVCTSMYNVTSLPTVILTRDNGDVTLRQYSRRAVMQFLDENT